MARHTLQVIEILRGTATELESRCDYQWGHMGSCNCGFLAQQITHLQKDEIHAYAMQGYGDWSEQLNDYCPTSGLVMDDLISIMIDFGFTTNDLTHLERLSDQQVLAGLCEGTPSLKHNIKADVVKYFRLWADLLEARLVEEITLPLPEFSPMEA